MKKGILFCLIYFIGWSFGFADSTKTYSSNTVRYVYLSDWKRDTFQFRNIDTLENGIQNFNPLAKNNIPFIYLGNLGTAYRPMFYNEEYHFGFDEGRHAFDAYLTKIKDLKFYRTVSPYTQLYYVWNRRQEQLFRFSFSQNLSPRFNYTINFYRMASIGEYQRQKSDLLNYDISLWYASKNRRYRVVTSFLSNSITVYENGGITNDSIFNVPSRISTEFEPVALNNARNKIIRRDVYVKQSYAFGSIDTLKVDTSILKRVQTKHRIFHDVNYAIQEYRYDENPLDSGIFQNIYYDSINTTDRIYISKLTNRVGYEYFGRKITSASGFDRMAFIVRNQLVDYRNFNIDTLLNNWGIISELDYNLLSKVFIKAEFGYGFSNDYQGNYFLKAQANSLVSNKKVDLTLHFFRGTSNPSITSTEFRSNHYNWNNNFKEITNTAISLDLKFLPSKFNTSIGYKMVSNYVYYDTSSMAKQHAASVSVISLLVAKNYRVGKVHFDNILNIQQSSNTEIIRQPLLHVYNSTYFQSFLLKKAIFLRTGFDTRFYTSYLGYNYNPATMQFFNSKDRKFGDFAILDFFVSAKVKRAVLLFKIENVGNQIFRDGEYMINNYPLPGRNFKIGFSWNFYD